MGAIRVVSTDTIKAPKSSDHEIDLTPWDLRFLLASTNKKGLLYHHQVVANQIERLRHSLSSALAVFQPVAGRLKITEHENNMVSCSVTCNNAGPTYVPPIVDSFFAFIGDRNYEGTSKPLLGVQVTELVDGVFIGCTFNHAAVDGKSMWHFINLWAEISRNCCHHQICKLPTLKRWFPNGIQRPIQFPFTMEVQKNHFDLSERVFHFTKEKIMQLKSKVNAETGTIKISSLQALLTHLWCSVIRSKQFDPQEEVHNIFMIGVRPRFVPPLPEDYFGNTIISCVVKMKAGELLEEGGLCKGATEMNKLIASYSDEKLKNQYESWLRNPTFVRQVSTTDSNFLLIISSSPLFDVYGNDFGWGKPVAVRSAYKTNGFVSVFAGREEGSIDLQVCLPYKILEAMGNDLQFMDVVSN
ncbi:shikimate O-hydroxycinnamoyltransferase [Trifolium repens]|nr:shikimate O-hydroxycinnamoyltransferase [Trifolium repens]